ncbi:hypothetical protein HanPI659440_Chr04g0157861 [Helianthus annuus]|nr:hypothetical protein HanPI659440_Chr04g0157861 [Helianthus annuus]
MKGCIAQLSQVYRCPGFKRIRMIIVFYSSAFSLYYEHFHLVIVRPAQNARPVSMLILFSCNHIPIWFITKLQIPLNTHIPHNHHLFLQFLICCTRRIVNVTIHSLIVFFLFFGSLLSNSFLRRISKLLQKFSFKLLLHIHHYGCESSQIHFKLMNFLILNNDLFHQTSNLSIFKDFIFFKNSDSSHQNSGFIFFKQIIAIRTA